MRLKNVKQGKEFLNLLAKASPIEILGVAKILQVPMPQMDIPKDEGDNDLMPNYDYDDIAVKILDAFLKESREKRKFLIKILKDATADIKQ